MAVIKRVRVVDATFVNAPKVSRFLHLDVAHVVIDIAQVASRIALLVDGAEAVVAVKGYS